MGVGFETTDDNNRKQVLDTHPLLSFTEIIQSNTGNKGKLVSDPRYVYAWRPFNNEVMTLNYLKNKFVEFNGEFYNCHLIQGFGDIYTFSEKRPTKRLNYGLEVFNSNGDLVFNSEQRPLKILDIINIADVRQSRTNINGNTSHWRKSYSVTAAVVFIQRPLWTDGSSFVTSGVGLRDSYISMEETVEERDAAAANRWTGNTYSLYALVIDVSNFK